LSLGVIIRMSELVGAVLPDRLREEGGFAALASAVARVGMDSGTVWTSSGGIPLGAGRDESGTWELEVGELFLERRNIPRNNEIDLSLKERPVELDLP
jgi:hypothetical protein